MMDIVELWRMSLQFTILPYLQVLYNVSFQKRFLITLEEGSIWKQPILWWYPSTVTGTVRGTVQESLQNKTLELLLPI